MRRFFDRCHKKGLSLALAKCKLFQMTAVFSGVTVSKASITPNPDKVAAIISWPEPKTTHELLAFLRLTGFFCRHIKGYTTIAQLLLDLTRDVQTETPRPGWKAKKGAYKRHYKLHPS